MSNSSRINKATNELDKAEKRVLYSLGLTEGQFRSNRSKYQICKFKFTCCLNLKVIASLNL